MPNRLASWQDITGNDFRGRPVLYPDIDGNPMLGRCRAELHDSQGAEIGHAQVFHWGGQRQSWAWMVIFRPVDDSDAAVQATKAKSRGDTCADEAAAKRDAQRYAESA